MTYRINLFRHDHLISTELFDDRLVDVKQQAIAAVDAGRAEQAEVRNSRGTIVLRHRRKLYWPRASC
ncbi:hypothetical protein [Sphingomonas alba]|uniref:Uncharacterized protein n=1 Tax=Sphingomonas alba TaxID=2908208 RepID=A0ABT0RQ53_9SPHN|nr:hypothetical protein [Sphingomonas alba]MCL6684782.1 hypothetical protein [Sphingomonas alba]